MKRAFTTTMFCLVAAVALAQDPANWLSSVPQAKDYVQHRVSSYDRSGGNGDARAIAPGETLTLLDEAGPGIISHVWVTIASDDPNHLKALVLRMYWDGESTASVEAPIGDFFGLGLGTYHLYQSLALSVSSDKALNCFLPMPFQKHARVTVTNEGSISTDAFYFNIDYRSYGKPLPADQLYFHAQYRQAAPNQGWTNQWKSNGDRLVNDKKNLDGDGQLRLDGSDRARTLRGRDDVGAAESGWVVGRRRRHVLRGRREDCRPSTERGRRIISWGPGISEDIRSRMRCLARRLSARRSRAGDRRCIDSIWIRRSRSRNLCARRSSMGTRTCGRIISSPLRIGIRASRMRLFPRCRRSSRGSRGFMRWVGQGTAGENFFAADARGFRGFFGLRGEDAGRSW